MNDLVEAFNEYFEIIPADSPELLKDVFGLRYQVYCQEARFEDPSQFSEELETDNHDQRAIHILLRHRPSGYFVGTARLILPDPLHPETPFPIEQHTEFDPTLLDLSKLPRQHTAEISRFAILSRFPPRKGQRRRYSTEADAEKRGTNARRRFPHPILALAVGIISLCSKHNIVHWFSAMDPALNRLLSLYGLHLDPIGPLVDYHGLRRPYYVDLIKVLNRMYARHRDVWELVTDHGKVWPAPLERRARGRHADRNEALHEPTLNSSELP